MKFALPVFSVFRYPDDSRQGSSGSARLQWFILLRGSGQQRWSGSCDFTSQPGTTISPLQIHRCISWPAWPEDRLETKIFTLYCKLTEGLWKAKMGMFSSFHMYTRLTSSPSKCLRSSLSSSFWKSLNQNVTLRNFFFSFKKMSTWKSWMLKWIHKTWL